MSRTSPLTVTYNDLVELADSLEKDAARKLTCARNNGVGNLNGLTHYHETTKRLAKMLKKGQPAKQTDMIALFNETH